jgi:hypothetical protein
LSPTPEQEVLLAKHFGCVRWVYNYFLNKRIEEYKTNKKTFSRSDNEKELPLLKKKKTVALRSRQSIFTVRCGMFAGWLQQFLSQSEAESQRQEGLPTLQEETPKTIVSH